MTGLTRIFPGDAEAVDLEAASSRDRLLGWYRPPGPQWLRLNLIVTVSGNTLGADGTSQSLTSPVDRRILGVIRELSDVVLIGARSLRAEGYLSPRRSRLAVVTSSGDLTGNRIDAAVSADPLLVLCPASASGMVRRTAGRANAEIVELPDESGRLLPADIVAALRSRGLRSIVCEGGPELAGQLVRDELVDELCLSTSPRLNGVVLAPLGAAAAVDRTLHLSQVLVDDTSGMYARWAIEAGHGNTR